MVGIVGATNDFIDALTQAGDTLDQDVLGATLADVDVSGLIDMRDRLAEVKGEGDDVVAILDEIIARLKVVQGTPVRPDDRAGARGPGAITQSNIRVDAEARDCEQRERRGGPASGCSKRSASSSWGSASSSTRRG